MLVKSAEWKRVILAEDRCSRRLIQIMSIPQIMGTFVVGLNITSISVATHTFDAKNKMCAVRIKARIINNMFSECKIKF